MLLENRDKECGLAKTVEKTESAQHYSQRETQQRRDESCQEGGVTFRKGDTVPIYQKCAPCHISIMKVCSGATSPLEPGQEASRQRCGGAEWSAPVRCDRGAMS